MCVFLYLVILNKYFELKLTLLKSILHVDIHIGYCIYCSCKIKFNKISQSLM